MSHASLHVSLDQASSQELMKYIGQQSPAPLLECGCSNGRCCYNHCCGRTG